jgi:hypothetical protein
MSIEFAFDDELDHVLIGTFKSGWTWADYHATNDAMLNYPPNIAIPDGIRVDQITDWRGAMVLPTDGVGIINVKKGHEITGQSDKDIPRNGGIIIHVGNPIFIVAMLRTFGLTITPEFTRQRVVSNIEKARDAIRLHRANSGIKA